MMKCSRRGETLISANDPGKKHSCNPPHQSQAMRWCLRLGYDSLAWSLRRLYCPVDAKALVLEVGSGANPYPRANVLLDAYEDTLERHWEPLIAAGRPVVLGLGERLPFRDQAFDFVIASHVLEHSTDPAKFLGELRRVAKAGYIEVPDAFMERVNPYPFHRLEVTVRNNQLLIRKKSDWRLDLELVELYEQRAKVVIARDTIRRFPFQFHVRFYWVGTIDFTVLNPDVDAAWPTPPADPPVLASQHSTPSARWRRRIVALLRTLWSQRRRNKRLRLADVLACPDCRSTRLSISLKSIRCQTCEAEYPVRSGTPALYPTDHTASARMLLDGGSPACP